MEFLIAKIAYGVLQDLKYHFFFLIESPTTLGPGGEGALLYKACTGVI